MSSSNNSSGAASQSSKATSNPTSPLPSRVQPTSSTTSLQSTLSAATTIFAPSHGDRSGVPAKNAPSSGLQPGAAPPARPETKAETKERKRREEEAKLSPEELRLAKLMGRYGVGESFGGMSMDYNRKAETDAKRR